MESLLIYLYIYINKVYLIWILYLKGPLKGAIS